jgi:uncharacterized protein YecT (DUF1311 family)
MTRCGTAWVLALLFAGCGSAAAQASAAVETRCPAGASSDRTDCARRNFRSADAALGIAYVAAMERVSAAQRGALRKEHRDWIAGRDPACKAEARRWEGTDTWELVFHACLEAATRRRTERVGAWGR